MQHQHPKQLIKCSCALPTIPWTSCTHRSWRRSPLLPMLCSSLILLVASLMLLLLWWACLSTWATPCQGTWGIEATPAPERAAQWGKTSSFLGRFRTWWTFASAQSLPIWSMHCRTRRRRDMSTDFLLATESCRRCLVRLLATTMQCWSIHSKLPPFLRAARFVFDILVSLHFDSW